MRISHKYKFIFICVPKTASESLRACLDPYSDIKSTSNDGPYSFHETASELKIYFETMGWDWSRYFKFAFVRNPWDRLVSFYHYAKLDKNLKCWNGPGWDENNPIEFNEWIKIDKERKILPLQLEMITGKEGALLVDFVGKFENLKKDWKTICDTLKIELKLPYINFTEHKHYSLYYTEETKKIIAETEKKEIEMFNYKFDKVGFLRSKAYSIRRKLGNFKQRVINKIGQNTN